MNLRSYLGKVFVVEASKAIIRDDQLDEQRYIGGRMFPSLLLTRLDQREGA